MKHLIISSIISVGILTGTAGVTYSQGQYGGYRAQGTTGSETLSLKGKQRVNFQELPAPIREAISSQAGDAPIRAVAKGTWQGNAYQVVSNQGDGRIVLQIAEDGSILSDSREHNVGTRITNTKRITYDQLPAEVQNVLNQELGSAEPAAIAQGTWRGTVYEARVDKPGMNRVLVASDGSIVKPAEFQEAAGAQAGKPESYRGERRGERHHRAGEEEMPGATKMGFDQLPWPVQKTILDQSNWAHIESVDKMTLSDGREVYRAVIPKQDQQFEIRVAKDGTILSQRPLGGAGAGQSDTGLQPLSGGTKVSFSELPQAAQRAARSRIGSVQIEDIDKGLLNGQVVYELAYKKGGRTAELRVTQDGKILGEHFD
jgi:uncharacterized membrane protein YkoI